MLAWDSIMTQQIGIHYSQEIYFESDVATKNMSESFDLIDSLLAALFCFIVTLIMLFISTKVLHWCLLPLMFCGVLIGSDAVAWARRKLDVFDPKALIGILGIHFFFISPMITVSLGLSLPDYIHIQPEDLRPWIGLMGCINFVGILFYKGTQHLAQKGETKYRRSIWVPMPGKTGIVLVFFLILSVSAEAFVLIKMGGFTGLVASRFEGAGGTSAFKMGIPRMLGYALPMVVFFCLAVIVRSEDVRLHRKVMAISALVVVTGLQFIVAGVSTSRGLILTAVVWMLMSIHYLWRPIRRKTLVLAAIPLLVFLWFYGIYKSAGVAMLDIGQTTSVKGLSMKTGRTFIGLLTGDLSRADIHANEAFVLIKHPNQYDIRYGKTYLTAITPIIPFWVWLDKPRDSGKVIAGTEILHGKGYYDPTAISGGRYRMVSANAYGIAGEAMLNFGLIGVPIAYALLGFFVGRFRRYLRGVAPGDYRWLIIPYWILFMPNLLLWDSDNYIAHFVLRGLIPMIVCFLMTVRVPLEHGGEYVDVLGVSKTRIA